MTNEMKEENQTKGNVSRPKSILERISYLLSILFNPFLVPLFAFALLFTFTYMNIMPSEYVIFVLGLVLTFTFLAPLLFIGIYKWTNRWDMKVLSEQRHRFIPYILTIMSYATCFILMNKMHFPSYISGIIKAALICITICTLLNVKWRVSIHMAGCGMLIGGLVSYGFLFYFNPTWWLCGFILLSGIQGTARISYHQHTLFEVIAGFVAGMFCGIIGILFI